MSVRTTLALMMAAGLMLSQAACSGGRGTRPSSKSGGGAKPLAIVKPKPKPKTRVHVGDNATVIQRNGRTYVSFRDDNEDGIPDED